VIGALGHPVRRRAELGRAPWALAVLAAGVGALVLTIVAVHAADAWFVQVMLDQAASRAADEVQLGLLDRVTPADFVAPFTSEHLDDLASRLDPVLGRVQNGTSGILRVNVVARDGTVLYSDLTAIRGRLVPLADKAELRTALDGFVGADEEALDSEENTDLHAAYGTALEVYVPVRLGGEVVGAYEIYQELGPLHAVRAALWGAVLGLWCLVLACAYVMRTRRSPANPAVADQTPSPTAVAQVNSGREPHSRLTPRELQVLRLMATSHTNRDIALQLVVSEETVRSHVKRILRKLDQPDRTQAVVVAVRAGLIELPLPASDTFHPIG
jgi:DNA-binding CsgD family transcriptional regulator